MSLFKDVLKSENSFTYMLRNLMEHDAKFGQEVFKKFLGKEFAAYQAGPFTIENQPYLSDEAAKHGRPDMVINAQDLILVVEAKVTTTCELTPLEAPHLEVDRGYLYYLQNLLEVGSKTKMVYLIPNNWQHERELKRRLQAVGSSVPREIVYWREVGEIARNNSDKLVNEFGKHLETFGMSFILTAGESNLLQGHAADFPKLVIKLNRLVGYLKQAVPATLAADSHSGFSAEGSDVGGEYGCSFKFGKKYLVWIGVWMDTNFPLTLAIEEKHLWGRAIPQSLASLPKSSLSGGWFAWDMSTLLAGVDPAAEIQDLLCQVLTELTS